MNGQDQAIDRAGRRPRGFVYHLILYFAAVLAIVPVNLILTPDFAWFLLPPVGWAGVSAIRVAWAMWLFDRFRASRRHEGAA